MNGCSTEYPDAGDQAFGPVALRIAPVVLSFGESVLRGDMRRHEAKNASAEAEDDSHDHGVMPR